MVKLYILKTHKIYGASFLHSYTTCTHYTNGTNTTNDCVKLTMSEVLVVHEADQVCSTSDCLLHHQIHFTTVRSVSYNYYLHGLLHIVASISDGQIEKKCIFTPSPKSQHTRTIFNITIIRPLATCNQQF